MQTEHDINFNAHCFQLFSKHIFLRPKEVTKLTTFEGEALCGKSHQGWGAHAPGATPDLPPMI